MSTEKTEALVIRQADFSETSRVVTLFTRDFGKISAMAKGARRLRGPFEAALDLLSACSIVFIRKSSGTLDLLTEAKLVSRFRPAPQAIKSLYAGYYVAELLNGLTEEYDPHESLYDHTRRTLDRIAVESDPTETILRYELIMLRELGLLPAFDHCEICGRAVELTDAFVFWVSQSGLLCPKCQREEYRQNPIQAGTLAVLRKLSQVSPTESTSLSDIPHRTDSQAATDPDAQAVATKNLVLSAQQLREIRRVLTAALSQALGRRPKMLRYLFS